MLHESKWGKLFYFIVLAIFPGAVNAALPSLPAQGAPLHDACSHLQEPSEAWRCRALLISQRVEQRQRYLHFLLQQNIFSIQTYDYLWREYQRTTSCSEIGAFLMSKVHDESFHGLLFTPIPPDDAINAPPAVFALQDAIN
ncbi:hypothetical protein [Klebsiella pasteurii]|uniref:hypothetical protein n=1 Tax=Klebsiella pasteurii TaxID=2587529 RepID=UPI00237B0D86|nr:hypothetical protein [Klebsiella pasteurii]MDD9650461.1 hypothetical protein [Klebsiella pasteurii]